MRSYYVDNGEQAVREVLADLLEIFNQQIKSGKDPKTAIKYFSATFEVKLLDFEGVDGPKEEYIDCTPH